MSNVPLKLPQLSDSSTRLVGRVDGSGPATSSMTIMRRFRKNTDVIASGPVLPRLRGLDATTRTERLLIYKRTVLDGDGDNDSNDELYVGPDGVLMKADMTLVKQSSTAGHLSPQPNQFLNKLMQGLDRINMEDAVDVNEETNSQRHRCLTSSATKTLNSSTGLNGKVGSVLWC